MIAANAQTKPEPKSATRNACRVCAPLGACLAFRGVEGALPFLHTAAFGFIFDDRWTLVENAWLDEPLRRLWVLLLRGEAVRLGQVIMEM